MTYQLYWGDLHSHSSISYGHGTVAQALARARQQLDFCSVTGHAFWPDMPTDRAQYGEIIDYHREGFARLGRNWEKLLRQSAQASEPGRFLALPSYEWHSCQYGDHNVYGPGPELALVDAPDLPALRQATARLAVDPFKPLLIPHHIGYKAGYRGIDWRHFDAARSPLGGLFSLHGCSESDAAPYPMLHDMGPRDAGSTAEAGWQLGHRFGVVGGTDHHSGYPGSHGDGRMGVFASQLTREALWEAFLARRVYAATGDKIDARLWVDAAWIGSEIRAPGRRHVRVEVRGCDALDRVELLKNGRVLRRLFPDASEPKPDGPWRLRVAWGWGSKDAPVRWNARLAIDEGAITRVETCFSGPPIVAPIHQVGDEELPDGEDLPHALVEQSDRACAWRSITVGNPTMRHPTTQAISLQLDAPLSARLTVEAGGRAYAYRLGDLVYAARTEFLRGWLTEAIRIGPLVPLSACGVQAELTDEPERDVDLYRLRAAQSNGQWVWLSPIWAER